MRIINTVWRGTRTAIMRLSIACCLAQPCSADPLPTAQPKMDGSDTAPPSIASGAEVVIPTSISPKAQQALAAAYRIPNTEFRRRFPPHTDTEAWIRINEELDNASAALANGLLSNCRCKVRALRIGLVPSYWVEPENMKVPSAKIVVVIHGGSLVRHGGRMAEATAAHTAAAIGYQVLAPDYGLAPQRPYPAALNEIVQLYKSLLENYRASDIVFYGISAGGNLAAAALLKSRDDGLPLPAALVLLSPEVDLTESGDSFHTNLGFDSLLQGSLMQANLVYAAGHSLKHPYLSPLFGDFNRGFPRTFIQSGTRDLFLSNAVRFHRALRKADIESELHVWEAMPHGGFGDTPEDDEVFAEIRKFLGRLQ